MDLIIPLLSLSFVFWLTTIVLPFIIWWPVRGTGLLRCAPWIVAWGVTNFLLRIAENIGKFSARVNDLGEFKKSIEESTDYMMGNMSASIVLWSSVANFLLLLIICANGAFLLSQIHAPGKTIRFLSSLYLHTAKLGLLMLVILPLPKIHFIWILWQLGLL